MNEIELGESFENQIGVPKLSFGQTNQPLAFKADRILYLTIPSSLSGITFSDSRLEFPKLKSLPIPKNSKVFAQIPTPKNAKADVLILPWMTNVILGRFGDSYIRYQFTIKFIKYIQNPNNGVKSIVSDNPDSQKTLSFYKDNPVSFAGLESALANVDSPFLDELGRIQYKLFPNRMKLLGRDNAAGLLQKAKSFIDKQIDAFLRQGRKDVLKNAGFEEMNVSSDVLVDDPRIKAMLDLIVYAEGTKGDYGRIADGVVIKSPFYPELIGQRNVSIENFSRFPEILVDFGRDGTTAAGRYQINSITWKDFGRGDFSPRSQDRAAVRIMNYEKVLEPLMSGNIRLAIFAAGKRWASFPKNEQGESIGQATGQKAKPIAELEAKYSEFRAKY